jgi:hypothetical protein
MKEEDKAELDRDRQQKPCPYEGTDTCDHCREVCPNLESGDDEER